MERVADESVGKQSPPKRPWHPPTVEEADYLAAEGGGAPNPTVFDGVLNYHS